MPANMNRAYHRTARPKMAKATGSDGEGITKPEQSVCELSSASLPRNLIVRARNESEFSTTR